MVKQVLMASLFPLLFFCFVLSFSVHVKGLINEDKDVWDDVGRYLVKKDQRRTLVSSEYGEISAVEIYDGTTRRPYHLEFFTLEPNSLFLPVLLHAEMVFYVHTGSGKLSWSNEEEMLRVRLQKGDVYRLQPGTILYLQSNLEPEREKLRISAIFASSNDDLHEPSTVVYSSVSDLVRGFDKAVLQTAFKVPEDVIEAITSATHSPPIVHAVPKPKKTLWEWEVRFINGLLGTKGNSISDVENKRKKTRTFNILNAKPDFQNCNGKSLTVTRKDLKALKGSDFGIFMVNLTRGAMMGPHWNPLATEISMVVQGQGMVRVVCSSNANESQCKNKRFRVAEGDVFAVPRYHPMAQMSFNNDSLVFVGFSTTTKKSYPQFLVGKASILQVLDKEILAASFNVDNTTIDQLLASQADSIILECTSCAEEEERIMEEEIERRREEEEAEKREEEEEKRKKEEEARKEEEEEEEEEAKRQEEEREQREREQEEEEKRRQEEEKRRQEEEEIERRREEEEAEKREEEEEKRKKEEEARKKEEEEEEEAKRQEEEREQREREQEEEKRRQEEEKRRQEEEEEATRQEEEREQREREQEEEEKRRQEEEKRRQEEEEEARRQEEEREQREREQEEEEKRRQEEEKRQQEEEARRQEEEREQREREQEEEEKRRQEEEKRRQEEEKERQGGGGGGGGYEGGRILKKMWKI